VTGAAKAAAVLATAALLFTLAPGATAHDVAPGASHADPSPTPAAAPPRANPTNRWGAGYFPNVPLVTQAGTTVRFYDDLLKGKSVAVNVIYTRCKDECPLETARMAQLARIFGDRMGRDIYFYSISIDPEYDTPEVLKAYAEKYDVGPGWLFLTGKPEDIKLIAKKIGLSRGSDAANRDGHTASLMVGDVEAGQWMRNSAVDDPQFLSSTIGTFLGWRNQKQGRNYAEARPLNVGQGEYLFGSRCSACHTIGQGEKIGPDLAGVTARRERGWLARYVQQPDRMLAEKDPIATEPYEKYQNARMPNVSLGAADVAAVLSYLESRDAAPQAQPKRESTSAR
jgi:protein SCO1/2